MADRHLSELEGALARRGWRIVNVMPGDDYSISASWEIQRSTHESSVILDFEGMDGSGDFCHPLEEAYGCQVRGRHKVALYFGKGIFWKRELALFVEALENKEEIELSAGV